MYHFFQVMKCKKIKKTFCFAEKESFTSTIELMYNLMKCKKIKRTFSFAEKENFTSTVELLYKFQQGDW